jgi:hypothetical protein
MRLVHDSIAAAEDEGAGVEINGKIRRSHRDGPHA